MASDLLPADLTMAEQSNAAQRRRHLRASTFLLVCALLSSVAVLVKASIFDTLSHPPPDTGGLGYNSFAPANTPGAIYVDPVFGSTVRRITTDHALDDIYARNMWWNADATKYLHNTSIINTLTGAETHTGIPGGSRSFDRGFDAADPNVLFYHSGSSIRQVTLGAGGAKADVLYLTTPAATKSLGGTINWMDGSGRYMVVRYGSEPSVRVYDRQNLAAGPYTNAVNGANVEAGGYIGLTPDGNFVVSGDQAWSINHATRTVSTSGTHYWDLCGDHGSFVSASDGRNYKITSNCNDANEFWRVDITNDVAGQSPAAQKAAPHNLRLLALPSWNFAQHATAVTRGPMRDWAFMSVEDITDDFNVAVNSWLPYRSEIVGLNVVTGEIRRLVHHRSRSVELDYFYQPRLSTSWGGEVVGWASNFNHAGEVDIFITPIQSGPGAPTSLRIVP